MSDLFYTNVRQWGNNLLYIGYNSQGKRVQKKIPFKPTLYVHSNKATGYSSYDGVPLQSLEFENIKEAKNYIDRYKDVSNFPIYGFKQFGYEFIAKCFPDEIKYDFSKIRIAYLDIEVYSGKAGGFDGNFPHPEFARYPISLITIFDNHTNKFISWGTKDYIPHQSDVEWRQFDTEPQMLFNFIEYWEKNTPDIITGWFTREFDIPYIVNRYKRILGEDIVKRLSPWGIVFDKKMKTKRFGKYTEIETKEIWGISELDYLDLYKKYSQSSRASYKLGFIGGMELGETKVDFEGSLNTLYETDHQKYVEYNIQDVNIVKKLEDKLRFLELIVSVAYVGKTATYNDALGTVKFWEVFIYNHLHAKNIIVPIKGEYSSLEEDEQEYVGGAVKEPIPGKYKWVVGFDVGSLYPSIIRNKNIGPETLVKPNEYTDELRSLIANLSPDDLINMNSDLSILKKYNYTLASNGKMYKKDKQSFLSELMEQLLSRRKVYKKLISQNDELYKNTNDIQYKKLSGIYDIKQWAMKIIANAGYGALGNRYGQYFSLDNAIAITMTGQVTIQYVMRRVNEKMNTLLNTVNVDYIIASDTDSLFLTLDNLINSMNIIDFNESLKFIDKFTTEVMDPFIKEVVDEFYHYTNDLSSNISLERETVADVAIWRKKKNYVLNVQISGKKYLKDSDDKLKIKGIEVVRSNTPAVCRDKLKKSLEIIMNKNEIDLQDFVKDFKKEWKLLNPEEISIPISINDLSSYTDSSYRLTKKSTPMHVRAANNYNKMLDKCNLLQKFEKIKDGDKIGFLALRLPNELNDDAIAFVGKIPVEFNLQKQIDYDHQFKKTFLNPLESITSLIGWNPVKKGTLNDLAS